MKRWPPVPAFKTGPARLLWAILAVAVLSACALEPKKGSAFGAVDISPEMILNDSPLATGAGNIDVSQVDILEMTPEMIEFIDAYVGGARNKNARLKRLVYAIIGDGNFELVYDDITRTAQETFREARGNCLSFTNLFIAMARYLEIHSEYQEVEIPPDWSIAGESFMFSQHVNVLVDLGVGIQRVVDFNHYDFRVSYEREVISDRRGRAHYFSNIGVEHMMRGETALAYTNFRQALLEVREFIPAWINMGVLHRREGYPNYAEASYKETLMIDRFNLIAMSNLANLYEEEGETELAEGYLDRVRMHRRGNPYYRYQIANSAFIEGDYKTAIANLKYAINKREEEDRFYFLLSLSYLMSGDREEAKRWMKKAEEVAEKRDKQQNYSQKLKLLISQDAERK